MCDSVALSAAAAAAALCQVKIEIIYIKWNEILFPLFCSLLCSHCWNKFRQVSWIRRRDLAILTSNTSVYTTDTRFNVIHIPASNNWDLRIKPVEERDAGILNWSHKMYILCFKLSKLFHYAALSLENSLGQFECQVNTDPKINFPIQLHVTSKSNVIEISHNRISPKCVMLAAVF